MNKEDFGLIKGEKCNRDGCVGIIDEHETDTSCSCHINPPCSHCVDDRNFCPVCGWEGKEDQREGDLQYAEFEKKNQEYYKKQNEEYVVSRDLFYKKYSGEIPADKLEIRSEGHTHFSMKKIGVFPKGSETYRSLLPKVVGTFGGRFTTTINEDSFRFEYIAYTD